MLFRRRKKDQIPTPKSAQQVRWIIGAVLALGIANNYYRHHSLSPVKSNEELKNELKAAAPQVNIDMLNLKGLMPESSPSITIKDVVMGAGEPAVCGQKVSLAYTVATLQGDALPDSVEEDSPLVFRIGGDKAMPALQQGVVGMRKSGRRLVFAPWRSAYGSKDFARPGMEEHDRIVFDVTLLDITPPLPDARNSPFRLSDMREGTGPLALCGLPVKVRLTVWDTAGKKLYSNAGDESPLAFTPGKSEVFLGLEQGVVGMALGGKRNLVVPPAFQKTMDGNAPKQAFPFPDKQTVLVDVETVP